MKIVEIIYTIFIAFVGAIVLLLVISVLPITGNYKVLTVLSGSMEPVLKTGSIVVVKPAPDYRTGDIITFASYGGTKIPTTHRIQEIQGQGDQAVYITKGDADNAADRETVKRSDIVGKVLFDVPFAGYAVGAAKKPLGFALIVIVPAAIVIFDEATKIYAELKKKKPNIA